jgi:hypothetical protein
MVSMTRGTPKPVVGCKTYDLKKTKYTTAKGNYQSEAPNQYIANGRAALCASRFLSGLDDLPLISFRHMLLDLYSTAPRRPPT